MAVETSVRIHNIAGASVDEGKFLVFYTETQPDKDFIRKKIEEKLGGVVSIRDTSPKEGGDYGMFFYRGDIYITYSFKTVNIEYA